MAQTESRREVLGRASRLPIGLLGGQFWFAPGQSVETREVAVEGHQFRGVLECDGHKLGTGDEVARGFG